MSLSPAEFLNLPTHWSMLRRAAALYGAEGDADRIARQTELNRLLEYYLPAVRAYLLGCCRGDAGRAEELVQAFSLRFLQGGFRNAAPEKGPFRHYLKRSLSNLVHQERARTRSFQELPEHLEAPDAPGEREFEAACMTALLDRAWAAFDAEFSGSSTPYAEALRLAMDPAYESHEARAAALSSRHGGPFSVDRFKKILSRSRHAFARHLYEEVARSFEDADPAAVADELAALGLLVHCEAFVAVR
jgi:DNA-directed RNA polymerase specialized sigma24 family protein